MTAYIIVGLTQKDTDKLQEYGVNVPSTLALYSGEVLIKSKVETLHGKFDYDVQVILAFPSRDHAYNWYHSDEYQSLVSIRNQGMESQFQLVG